jgi:hypothetical protein
VLERSVQAPKEKELRRHFKSDRVLQSLENVATRRRDLGRLGLAGYDGIPSRTLGGIGLPRLCHITNGGHLGWALHSLALPN